MTNVSTGNFRENLMDYLNAAEDGKVIHVANGNRYVVILSEKRFRQLEKAEQNAAYLKKIEDGFAELNAGGGVSRTLAELEAMAEDDG